MTGVGGTAAVELVNVPFNSSGLGAGVARMPAVLLAAGLAELLDRQGPTRQTWVEVIGPTPERGPSGLIAEQSLQRMLADTGLALTAAWAGQRRPVVVAGDCPVLLAPLLALGAEGGAGLVFIDGHEDAWSPAGSVTGEAADCELGLALGLFVEPDELGVGLPCLAAGHTLVLGPRDLAELQQNEQVSIADRVAFVSGEALGDRLDEVPGMVRRTAATAPAGWWLHVDLDVLSTEALAAVDYLQPGGLSWDQLERLTGLALQVPGCRGASVVIYNPDLDGGLAARRIAEYVARLAALLRSSPVDG